MEIVSASIVSILPNGYRWNQRICGQRSGERQQSHRSFVAVSKLRLDLSLVPAKNGSSSQLQIESGKLEPSFGIRGADVYVAYALNRAESRISAVENAGHRLTHVSVVTRLNRIGEIRQGERFSQQLPLNQTSGFEARDGRVIVFVQEPHQGRVIGAAVALIPAI